MTITGAGSVGIGTTAPGSLLHLYSSGSATGLNVEANGNAAIQIKRSNATQPGTALLQVTNLGRLNVQADDYITLSPGNAEQFRITTAGNIGIGTTSPATKLDVSGPVKVAGTGSEACSATTIGAMRYNAAGNYMEICSYP